MSTGSFGRRSHRGEGVLVGALLLLLFVGGAVCTGAALFPPARQRSIDELLGALALHQPGALDRAEEHLRNYPDDPFGLVLAARAAGGRSEHELAIGFLKRVTADGGLWELLAQLGMARHYEALGRIASAEQHLQRALELSPGNIEAHDRLGHLLQVEGRAWESAPHLFFLIRRGKCRGDELLGVASSDRYFREDEWLNRCTAELVPPEVILKLPQARHHLFENRADEAERLLRELVQVRPDLGEAQGRLGRIFADRGDSAEFARWVGELPAASRDHPEVWLAQGLMANRTGQIEAAVSCFLEVLARSPNHLTANLQIAGCLQRLGKIEAAWEFSRRAELLSDVERNLGFLRNGIDEERLSEVIGQLGRLGRHWEAAGWAYLTTHLAFPQEAPQRALRHWLPLARGEAKLTAPETLPTRLLGGGTFAPPRWSVSPGATGGDDGEPSGTVAWSFTDDAARLGVHFEYYEGSTEEDRLQHIFNVTGGGLAAIDYDLDGWPDLYLAQARNWRSSDPQPQHIDRLYRNLHERFEDVTLAAGLAETGFSHGVAAGDFDQDGFVDLYIGNLGPNRLYHNNGDGTFSDSTQQAGVAGNEWTTSSVFADFNGDGLPDLYVLNYSDIEDTTRRECPRANGESAACTPGMLIAEPDRCYLNLGDGTFRDISEECGIHLADGRGLGSIVWDFEGNGRLGIFVANDTSPSFLFLNDGCDERGVPKFREEGIVRGVALDLDGSAQASMGVAAGDVTGDGRIDLFVTTFFGESKTLFSQHADGFFYDLTRSYRLREPGFWMLGFGCQFADLDCDGWEDLVVTNGHVDQQSSRGDPDRMPPQVFHNRGGRTFDEVSADALGPFFQGTYLGRGLATLDWNRDGLPDVAISHLHAPLALLTNRTPPASEPLVVRLIGRTGCREPTGAAVKMTAGKKEQVRLQTAGDGFLVTNERRLHFAVPRGNSTVDLEVRWPGGRVERWSQVPSGGEVVLIEGQPSWVLLRKRSE